MMKFQINVEQIKYYHNSREYSREYKSNTKVVLSWAIILIIN